MAAQTRRVSKARNHDTVMNSPVSPASRKSLKMSCGTLEACSAGSVPAASLSDRSRAWMRKLIRSSGQNSF